MDVGRLKRVLLALPDAALRVAWLVDDLAQRQAQDAARLLNALAEESETADPEAREALLTLVLTLAHPDHGALVETLRVQTALEPLFSLERIIRRAPPPSVRAPPPEEARIPDYGRGRELSLGERKSLARRPDRRSFERLLLDPHPQVIRNLLDNPKMVEDDAIRVATLRPARTELIKELARSPRWLSRPRVRMAIALNPGSPPEVAIPLVSLCCREELADILKSTDTSIVLRGVAQEYFVLRPPLKGGEVHTVH